MNGGNPKFKRIAIKIGSNVLTRPDGTLATERMAHFVSQIAALHGDGVEVILISSGAVAAGRTVIATTKGTTNSTAAAINTANCNEVATRQLCAAVGQAKLMNIYFDLFQAKGLIGGQVLTTKENFFDDVHYFNQKTCMEAMLENDIIPIVNENDTVSVTELMFTDNDELAGLVAVMMGCSALIILSNIDGIYSGDPSSPDSHVIAEADECEDLACFIRAEKSALGRGGMTSKVRIAKETANKGVYVIIANGTRENIITDVIHSNPNTPRTRFCGHYPSDPALSSPCSATAIEMMGGRRSSADGITSFPSAPTAVAPAPPKAPEVPPEEEAVRRIDAAARAVGSLRTATARDPTLVAAILTAAADALIAGTDAVLKANAEDLARMDETDPKYDRLKLTAARLEGIAGDMRSVATLPSPLGKVLSEAARPNGMTISKVTVPFGVVGVIYEARPNVTADVFALCIASGNVSLLKGGADAAASNESIAAILRSVLESKGVDPNACTLLPPTREAAMALLHAEGKVDVVIPRGSQGLIEWVRRNSRIPAIETGAGVCHAYVDESADVAMAAAIVTNAKCRRVSVCNALDCLLIHSARLGDLKIICAGVAAQSVVVYADEAAFAALEASYPSALLRKATAESFGTEFLGYSMSVRTVASVEEAAAHIDTYGSRHSECIVAAPGAPAAAVFQSAVDAACVYTNVSTAFTDGAQFGFGAEIGISTQKLHARGPMALPELTTYKYLVKGSGQIRE